EEEGLLGGDASHGASVHSSPTKTWELHLGIQKVLPLASKIKTRADPASDYLWLSVSDKTRGLLATLPSGQLTPTDQDLEKKLKTALAVDFRNIIQSGWIYEEKRFDKASTET